MWHRNALRPVLSHACAMQPFWGASLSLGPGGHHVVTVLMITADPPAYPSIGWLASELWGNCTLCVRWSLVPHLPPPPQLPWKTSISSVAGCTPHGGLVAEQ